MSRPRRRWAARPWAMAPVSVLVVALTLLIAATVRIDNITSAPHWYPEEGDQMEAAWNALTGESRIGPLSHTPLSPWLSTPPLHAWTSGAMMHFIGALRDDHRPNIQPLRWHSALCGIATVALLMALGQAAGMGAVGLVAGMILAVDPWSVMLHRMGLPHPMLGLEIIATGWMLAWHLQAPRWWRMGLAVAVASLAPLTLQMGIAVPLALAVALLLHGRTRAGLLSLLAFAPLAILVLSLLRGAPPGLVEEMRFAAESASMAGLGQLLRNLIDLLTISPMVPVGLAGLALLPRSALATFLQVSGLLLLLTWLGHPSAAVGIQSGALELGAASDVWGLAALLPLLALGTAQAFLLIWRQMRGDATDGRAPGGRGRFLAGTAICLVAASLVLGTMLAATLRAINDVTPIGLDAFEAQRGFQAPLPEVFAFAKGDVLGDDLQEGVAEYLWSRDVGEDALIIAETPLWWTLPGRHATLAQSLAYDGTVTLDIPIPVDRARFVYPCDWHEAQWAVLGPLTSRWAAGGDAAIRNAVREIETRWSLAHRSGALRVYASPQRLAVPVTAEPVSP